MLGEVRLTATGIGAECGAGQAVVGAPTTAPGQPAPPALSAKALAGQALFFDTSLSDFDPKPHPYNDRRNARRVAE